mgnify:CR=1 FL=1
MFISKKHIVLFMICIATITSCSKTNVEEINIGYIAPLTTLATDLGVGPSQAMILAVEQYNSSKTESQPKINLFIEDDKWEKDLALPLYEKLRKEHNIDIVFISNTDGTVAIQDRILEDDVIAVNPLNNDKLLSSLNRNTFKIAKSTEESNKIVGVRIIELGFKKVIILQYPNDFMKIAANSVQEILLENGVQSEIVVIDKDKDQKDFTSILKKAKDEGTEAYVFFGYKKLGFAMKQARDLGIDAPFFGSTTLLDPEFHENSEGAIVGTECSFFTPLDGNYILASEFLQDYKLKFGEEPFSIWPPMQAYDAMNIIINTVKSINEDKLEDESQVDWLRNKLFNVKYYQGVCGNISILEDGSSRGIYFSLYKVESDGKLIKIKR